MTAFRLALTYMSKQQLEETNNGNMIKNITRPTGMNGMLDWVVLGDHDIYQPFGQLVKTFNGGLKARGAGSFTWDFAFDYAMANKWRELYYGRTASVEGDYSALVTVQTKSESFGYAWKTLNATMGFPEQITRRAGNLWLYRVPFVECVDAPDGVDLTVAITDAGASWSVAGGAITTTYTVTNDGDTANVSDIILTCPIPAKTELATVTAGNFTVEYSDDNESSYSASVPSPIDTTTHVRFTLAVSTDPISAGGTDVAILGLQPITEGAESVTASVVTDYETDDTNNSDSLAITVVA